MRNLIISVLVAVATLAVGALALAAHARSRSPESLLRRLERGEGDREELIMRLNVAHGDIVGPMMEVMQDTKAPGPFRADVLELLFKRHFRAPDPRIEKVILTANRDPQPEVRQKAAYCLAVYGNASQQATLVDSIDDPDPNVRRQAYMVLGAQADYDDPEGDIWPELSLAQKDTMVQTCRKQAHTEETPEMRRLARAIVGRQIEILGRKAVQALQSSDLQAAEKTLRDAVYLDAQNSQAQIRLTRFYLKTGQKEQALEVASQYSALIEVPRLSEAPVIDGDPDDAVWGEAYTANEFYITTSRWVAQRTKGRSRAHIGHHEGKIYIAVAGYEEDLSKLVQSHTSRDSDVWRDDCVELVFDPDHTEKDYYQFVINPAGSLYDADFSGAGKNFPCEYKARVFDDRGYWACEFALDGKDLDDRRIEPGTVWSLNVFRTRIGPASEHGGIWPLYGRTHRLDLYPIAIFK